jgi:penicillin-binding protein 2
MENPEIAVVALFEHGVESYNAVPIVRDVLKAYFDKKARQGKPLPEIQTARQHAPIKLLTGPAPAVLSIPFQEGLLQ